MREDVRIWSVCYADPGGEYSMQIVGTRYEIDAHCDRLGMSVEGEIIRSGYIPSDSAMAMCMGITRGDA